MESNRQLGGQLRLVGKVFFGLGILACVVGIGGGLLAIFSGALTPRDPFLERAGIGAPGGQAVSGQMVLVVGSAFLGAIVYLFLGWVFRLIFFALAAIVERDSLGPTKGSTLTSSAPPSPSLSQDVPKTPASEDW